MAGIYVHIPFCKKRCSYCDFHFSTTFSSYREKLIGAICSELEIRKSELHGALIETVYFGGGTPSLLTKEELTSIMSTIRNQFQLSDNPEITFEVNPDDATAENLADWKKLGINRLSIGLQSFQETDLAWMNRSHSTQQGEMAVRLAQAKGFNNISIDLIYGLPELSNEQWVAHLNQALKLNVQHISSYCLTIEPKTALNHFVASGKLSRPTEDQQSEQFDLLVSTLAHEGFEQYEISNFAKDQKYAKHNSAYWNFSPYLGVGPSAHSFNGHQRRWNVANNTKYYQQVGKNQDWFELENLTESEKWNEYFLTGLRTKWGILKNNIQEMGGLNPSELTLMDTYLKNEWILEANEYFVLTEKGKLQADGIASSFFRLD
ncbi:MAG: radical SAM family heme chaperone HemW [Crocinitomicaceae bacterium]|nr:radical SAM family heme chaperone HemW [Crocinitomicaceae bacterium]